MPFYQNLARAAGRLIADNVQSVVTLRKIDNDFDPATGAVTQTTTDFQLPAIGSPIEAEERDKSQVRSDGFVVTIAADGIAEAPDVSWQVVIGTNAYQVTSVLTVPPIGQPILYKLHVRF